MSGLGPYYDPPTEIEPDVRMGPGASFGTETLLSIFKGDLPGAFETSAPLGVYTEWAEQSGDLAWKPVGDRAHLLLYPLTDRQLATAERAAFGHAVPFVGVLTPGAVLREKADGALDATPYGLSRVVGVYREDDPYPVPRGYVLYWAERQDDPRRGGRGSLEAAARALGGRLVFPYPVQHGPGRARPEVPFGTALAVQAGAGPESTAATLSRMQRGAGPTQALAGKILAVSGDGLGQGPSAAQLVGWAAVLGVAAAIFWPRKARRRVRP